MPAVPPGRRPRGGGQEKTAGPGRPGQRGL